MKSRKFVMIAAVAAMLILAGLPAVAGAVDAARRIEASEELKAFFEALGVDAIYLGKSQGVPADQWKRMVRSSTLPTSRIWRTTRRTWTTATMCSLPGVQDALGIGRRGR
jgi:hypothetical protein